MANTVRVGFQVTGASKGASDLDKLKDKFTKLQSTTAKGFITGVGAGVGLSAFNLVGQAISEVTGALGDSVTAYQDESAAQARLTTSLNANAPAWHAQADAIEAATQASVKLGFTDSDTTNSLALLVGATHDAAEALKVLSVAQDLARFKGISLQDASAALTSIEAGRSRGLAALGINVKDFATTEERLAAVEKVAGGQAQSYANTDLGKLTTATAEVDAAQAKFGKGLSEIEAVVLPAAADAVGALGDAVANLSTQLDSTSTPLQKVDSELALLHDLGGTSIPIIGQYVGVLDKAAAAQHEAAIYAAEHGDELIGVRSHVADFTAAEKDAIRGASGFTGAVNTLDFAFQNLDGSIQSTASTLENDLFGKAITKGKEADLRSQLVDLNKQLKGTTGDKRTGLLGQIASVKEALFDMDLQAAESAGPDALIAFLDKEKAHTKDLTKAELDLIDTMESLARKQKILNQITNPSGLQYTGAGGDYHAPTPHDPVVIKLSQPTKPGVTNINVHVNMTGGVITPGVAYTLAQKLGPFLAKYLQSHNLVPHQAVP